MRKTKTGLRNKEEKKTDQTVPKTEGRLKLKTSQHKRAQAKVTNDTSILGHEGYKRTAYQAPGRPVANKAWLDKLNSQRFCHGMTSVN